MKILITNDDSHRSPLLELAVEHYSRLGEVSLVVPQHEQSWTGKSMTRFSPVHVQKGELFGRSASFVSGTPADCVNVAVHNLLGSRPDMVVSGINAGFNMGLGFVLSSGTVGACLEANLAGIPAIALSQAFDSATRNSFTASYMIDAATMESFRSQTERVLSRLNERLFGPEHRQATLGCPVTWNVNIPFYLTDQAVLRAAPLGKTRYGKVFHEEPTLEGGSVRVFAHSDIEKVPDNDPACDSSLIGNGCATVSAVSVWNLAGGHQLAQSTASILAAFTG
jgi:5'/3'-nucleotidase SurE